jgi:hypothetical protein
MMYIFTLKILELLFIFLLGIAYGAVHLEPAYFVCSEELFLSLKGAFPLKEINSGFRYF